MESEKLMRPDLIITLAFGVISSTAMILMGMEIIHNEKVVDKLLVTIPTLSALIAGYWFNKVRDKEGPK
jgi:uncharacterized membrane protein YccF (DUF307 family)